MIDISNSIQLVALLILLSLIILIGILVQLESISKSSREHNDILLEINKLKRARK